MTSRRAREGIEHCLARIAERDAEVRAWTYLDAESARRSADAVDEGRRSGPLAGLAIGVKDVIDVAGMPTGCNSPIEADRPIPTTSADAVARLQEAGAIVVGKTVTTEYAFMEPGPTRNPLDLTRTPGGSSSGSAAAVADGHVPVALATQTGGSTIRPAAFCGIVGYKPPYGFVPARGVAFLAPSLDVVGVHARSVADVAKVAAVLEDRPSSLSCDGPPSFAVVRLPHAGEAEASVDAMMAAAIAGLRASGCRVREVPLSPVFNELDEAHRVVMSIEVARSFREAGRDEDPRLSRSLRDFVDRGRRASSPELASAQSIVARAKASLFPLAAAGEMILTPAALGEAPVGLAATGSSLFNRPWSLLHLGAVTVPSGRGAHGLPLGLQIADPTPSGENLLAAAAFAENALKSSNDMRLGDIHD